MTQSSTLQAISRLIVTVALPIVLLATPLYFFVTPGFVRHEYGLGGFPPSQRFDQAERLRLSDTIIHYLRGRASVEDMATMRTEGGETAMRPEEVDHIVDVKGVMDGFFVAHAVSTVALIAALVVLWRGGSRAAVGLALQRGLWVIGGLILLILLASFVDFDTFFTRFHKVFFREGTWTFWIDDTLIQLYPLPLWMHAVWKIGAMVLIEASIVLGISRWLVQTS